MLRMRVAEMACDLGREIGLDDEEMVVAAMVVGFARGIEVVLADGEVFATQPEELWWFAFRGRIFLCSSNHGRRGIDAEYIEAAPGEFDAMATEPAADIDESIPRCCWQDRKDKIDFSGSSTPGQQGVCQVG